MNATKPRQRVKPLSWALAGYKRATTFMNLGLTVMFVALDLADLGPQLGANIVVPAPGACFLAGVSPLFPALQS